MKYLEKLYQYKLALLLAGDLASQIQKFIDGTNNLDTIKKTLRKYDEYICKIS